MYLTTYGARLHVASFRLTLNSQHKPSAVGDTIAPKIKALGYAKITTPGSKSVSFTKGDNNITMNVEGSKYLSVKLEIDS